MLLTRKSEGRVQAVNPLTRAASTLATAGATLADVVRTRMYLTSVDDVDAVSAVHGERFGDVRPAATMVVVAGLVVPAWRVEVEAEAVIPEEGD